MTATQSEQSAQKAVWFFHPTATPRTMPGLHRPDCFCKYLRREGYAATVFSASFLHYSADSVQGGNRLYTMLPDTEPPYVMVKTPAYHGNGISRVLNMLTYFFRLFPVTRRIGKLRGKPDAIIASSPHILAPLAGVLIARRYKCRAIVEIRDLWPESIVGYGVARRSNPIVKLLYAMEKWIYAKADAIIFTMEGGRDYIVAQGWDKAHGGPVDLGKVFHINNGVDLAEFDADHAQYVLQDADLDDPGTFKAVYTGSVRRANHLDDLVDAASVLSARGENAVKILVYGEGTERERLVSLARQRGLTNIVFKDAVEKKYVPYILSKGDLNLMQGQQVQLLQYGISWNKAFEYLASGKPLLANIAFAHDFIAGNGCGRCEAFDSPEAYADAILSFADMPEETYRSMCGNARETAKQYDFQVLTKKLIHVIEGD